MNDSFHLFLCLPLELRRIIWKLCLPYRIAEGDIVFFHLDGKESRQACYNNRTTLLNAQPPVIAFVNSESRQVALEEGHWYETNESTSLSSIWVQPRRDVLHLNWTRHIYRLRTDISEPDTPIAMFLTIAEEDLGMQSSVTAEIIHSFNLKVLLDDPDSSNASDTPASLRDQELENWERNLGICRRERNLEVFDIAAYASISVVLNIAMAAVSLHIPKEVALRSGLFGLLGDAPVQMVDVGDHVALWKFQTLFRQYASDKEPAVQTLFDLFTSSRFEAAVKTWVGQAEWCILQEMWRLSRSDLGPNPGSTWIPYLPDIVYFSMSEYLPDESHPWVKEARQTMPRLRPRIMVRYCSNECYIKERLPEYFRNY
jgi:hypothetical protein